MINDYFHNHFMIMEIFSCEMSAKLEAQDNAWSSKFSEIDRKNQL